ncbi:tetratricopeptide repeat protein [Flavobacteriaceae bacterium SZ-1-7]|uniref:tetratricopeptide repeat protein n=1 Tax=Tamlana sedimenti TaxID=3134126 RepID=UPI0031232999
MKQLLTVLLMFSVIMSFSQEKDKAQLLALKKANNYVYEGNSLLQNDDVVSAEMEYRKAISEQPKSVAGAYNLGNTYIKNGNFDEAIFRLQEAAEAATSKSEKHKAFHNIGNVLMQNKKCKEAVEAYKNALRNDPTDDETRYNFALAKACAEQQQDQQDQQDQNQDKQDENKDNQDQKDKDQQDNQDQENKENQDKEGNDKEDKKDEGDQDKKDGEDKKDENGKPKDEKQDQRKGDEEKEQQQPKPQPGQLSPQQIKNLLEAMNNQEQKVQEKMNAEKQQGVIIQTDKDW